MTKKNVVVVIPPCDDDRCKNFCPFAKVCGAYGLIQQIEKPTIYCIYCVIPETKEIRTLNIIP